MKGKPATIDEYLADVPADQRAALQKLRQTIKSFVPEAEEYFYYQLPAFRYEGKRLVAFGAATHHCSLYPLSAAIVKIFQAELKNYDTSPGTIRFLANQPLPATLIKKIVTARLAENESKRPARAPKK